MSTPINFNRARKDIERARKKQMADENAVRFGRTRAERLRQARLAEIAKTRLDGQEIEKE